MKDVQELIEKSIDEGMTRKGFNLDFLLSIYDSYEKYGRLTDKQYSALKNVAKGLKVIQ